MPNNLHISYDLHQPDRNYHQVMARIKALGDWAKLQKSFFFVSSEYTASRAARYVLEVMHDGDKLYVVDATNNNAAWFGNSAEVNEYVQEHWGY